MHVVPKFEGDHFFLSNFYEAPTRFVLGDDMVVMATGEHAFQAAKGNAMLDKVEKSRYVLSVADAPTPAKAKYLGRSAKIDLDWWERIKVDCMREVVFQKFLQNPELRGQLLKTGDAMLVEGNTWDDKFWGRVDGKGYNKLGVILMEVRGYWLWQTRRNNPEMGS
ncbi:hypothetical protein SEA_PATELGO_204 [Streptomyces phage Patelgo]|nr:hypothetical protein SEA_PATELGO_204 [Streptomyces phage Patelgo]